MQKKLPKIISQEEFERILKVVKDKEYKLAFLLAFEAGMRISEIVGLKKKGSQQWSVPPLTKTFINAKGNQIRIQSGKGGKDRIVPLPKRVNATAIKLLPLKVSRRTLQRKIFQLGKKVLERDITFHTLRHGFASHLAERDVPLHEIQMLLGHSRLDTTGIYLHANPKRATEKARELF